MKMAVFWVVASCNLVEVYQRFRGTCCLRHQGDDNPEDSHLHAMVCVSNHESQAIIPYRGSLCSAAHSLSTEQRPGSYTMYGRWKVYLAFRFHNNDKILFP
jgi:hypothetical protein